VKNGKVQKYEPKNAFLFSKMTKGGGIHPAAGFKNWLNL